MSLILAELRKLVDIIVIDTPPALVADAQILAGKVDAVLMVIQPGHTHSEAARAALELFKRAGSRVIGTVLNRIPRNRAYYYGGYRYYSAYSKNGYYSRGAEVPARDAVPDVLPTEESEPLPSYSILGRLTNVSKPAEEVPPPDPPRS
jgi:Mrp family chromosome partitioning ATPase